MRLFDAEGAGPAQSGSAQSGSGQAGPAQGRGALLLRVARLAKTCLPAEAGRARRRLGEAATPERVLDALEGHTPMTRPPGVPAGADDHVWLVGHGMPDRLASTWPQGGPLWAWWRVADPGVEAPAAVVAVVGTRRATHDGQAIARRLAAELAEAGVEVVSGLARGIDQAAHRGALEAGGRTLAVLGTGLDVDYPSGTRELRRRIVASGGLVTEQVHGFGVRHRSQFTARNRILVGLADAVVVVEAGARSGALNSASWAADLGREVLVVPASPSSPTAAGSLQLLREGAVPVRDASDVMAEIGLTGRADDRRPEVPREVPPEVRAVHELLSPRGTSMSALADAAGLPVRQVLVATSTLEALGLALRLPDGRVASVGP